MNLSTRITRLALLALVCAIQYPAEAWGPLARRTIAQSAYKLLQYEIYDVAKAGPVSYEADVLRGATDGAAAIEYTLPVHSDQQAIEAIGYEIYLLREIRKEGMGSHFAYRLGVLSALIGNTMQPFGNPWTDDEERIHDITDQAIEDRARENMSVVIRDHKSQYISSFAQYVKKNRPGFEDDMVIIREDFRRGINERGFTTAATPTYFRRSVLAVCDVWKTILGRTDPGITYNPSREAITWYYVDEIGYLLNVRENIEYANRAYKVYQRLNPGIIETHIAVGDLYYHFGTRESREIGVTEWKIAQRTPGKYRKQASRLLSDHYISEGESYVAHSKTPESLESDLPDALHSYESALEFDRTNAIAARKISDTSVAIQDRKRLYTEQQQYIDGATLAIQSAEEGKLAQDFGSAIGDYGIALGFLELVDNEFRDLAEVAKQRTSDVKKNIKSTVRAVINLANANVEAGDNALLNTNYDEAIRNYRAVDTTLRILSPDSMTSVDKQSVDGLLASAEQGINDAKVGKEREAKRPNPTADLDL
ncbi:MAG: hypothetical protein VCD00_01900 [Candidatus Hydrogenedentota bacterium]